jgi:hypothetical protein
VGGERKDEDGLVKGQGGAWRSPMFVSHIYFGLCGWMENDCNVMRESACRLVGKVKLLLSRSRKAKRQSGTIAVATDLLTYKFNHATLLLWPYCNVPNPN